MIIDNAPKGVTTIAGANAYAAKFAISPSVIESMPTHHKGSCKYPNPPSPARFEFARELDSFNPFFFMMNEAPIQSEEPMARSKPFVFDENPFVSTGSSQPPPE
jgi:hypothetical protein